MKGGLKIAGHAAGSGGATASGSLAGTGNKEFLLFLPSNLLPVPTIGGTRLEPTSMVVWELHFPEFYPGIQEHGEEG